MSKAFLSSSSSHSTITETFCDFYPDNSNQDLVFFSRKNERSCYQKKPQDYVIDKTSPATCDNYVSGNRD